MKVYTCLPFFYFQNTRLNNIKALVFHTVYEWLPVALIAIYYLRNPDNLLDVLVYYLAFISIYEIGYIVNDQQAHAESEGRKRTDKLSVFQLVVFIGIRLSVFLIITVIKFQYLYELWWCWYFLLALQFALHNVLEVSSLKVLTFLHLAFVRFLSPIIMMLPFTTISPLLLPVIFNYALFRLFTYMDSKGMLKDFERKSNSYHLGYYLVLLPFSALLSFLHGTWVPLLFNLYYLIIAIIVSLVPYKARLEFEKSIKNAH